MDGSGVESQRKPKDCAARLSGRDPEGETPGARADRLYREWLLDREAAARLQQEMALEVHN